MITACGTAERIIEDLKKIDTERKRTPEKSGTLATNLAGIASSNRMGEKDEGLTKVFAWECRAGIRVTSSGIR